LWSNARQEWTKLSRGPVDASALQFGKRRITSATRFRSRGTSWGPSRLVAGGQLKKLQRMRPQQLQEYRAYRCRLEISLRTGTHE
jgi:hypothetical protein